MEVQAAIELFAQRLGSRKGESVRHYQTAMLQAHRTGAHVLCPSYTTVSLSILQGSQGAAQMLHITTQLVNRSTELRAWDTAMTLLPHRLREYMLGEQVGYGQRYRQSTLPNLSDDQDVIRVHYSAVLAADVPWERDELMLQTVRAKSAFHGRPYVDAVQVKCTAAAAAPGTSSGRITSEFACLLLLLEARVPNQATSACEWQPLAYVRWFEHVREEDALTPFKAVPLKWDKVHD